MITTQQWRAFIDTFAGGRSARCTPDTSRDCVNITPCITPRSWYGVIIGRLLLCSYSISLFVIVMLLVCSGNVEINPEPVNCKKCPACLIETVPIKLKVCTCGHIFHKKSCRQPPKNATSQPLTSHVEVVTDSDIDPVQSQPVVSKTVASDTEVVTDPITVTDGDPVSIVEVQSQPVIGKSVISQKWERYKKDINNSRREKYKTNSEAAKSHSYKLYHQNPELFKTKKQVSYNFNPSPVKERVRKTYRFNSSPVKAQKREVYRSNPSPVKERVRKTYRFNSSPVKAQKREVYRSNPSPVKERVRKIYLLIPSPVKAHKRKYIVQILHQKKSEID